MVLAVKSTKKKVLKKISANLRLLNALMSMKELARKSIEKYLMNRAMFASIQYLNAKESRMELVESSTKPRI